MLSAELLSVLVGTTPVVVPVSELLPVVLLEELLSPPTDDPPVFVPVSKRKFFSRESLSLFFQMGVVSGGY